MRRVKTGALVHMDKSEPGKSPNLEALTKKAAGSSSTPGWKQHPDLKGVRDVSLQTRRHRECEEAGPDEPAYSG